MKNNNNKKHNFSYFFEENAKLKFNLEEKQVQFNLLQERTDVGIADLTEINNQLQDMLEDKNMEIELMRKSPTQPLSYPTGGLFDNTEMHMVVPHSQRRRKKKQRRSRFSTDPSSEPMVTFIY